MNLNSGSLLSLLQLVAVPVGAFSYSEGLEFLVFQGQVKDVQTLKIWLMESLKWGAIRLEAAIMLRVYRCQQNQDLSGIKYWNSWATAAKETEELRLQSLHMGKALSRLLIALNPSLELNLKACGECNFAVAFALAAQSWNISEEAALLGYLQSWANNLIGAGVKLIPLGQTSGQQLLLELQSSIVVTSEEIVLLEDDDLKLCSWGLSLASMNHETLYTRLFRS